MEQCILMEWYILRENCKRDFAQFNSPFHIKKLPDITWIHNGLIKKICHYKKIGHTRITFMAKKVTRSV